MQGETPTATNKKASNLVNKLNFHSSLSVALTTETDESKSKSPTGQKSTAAVNNYIEIVKLPEVREVSTASPSIHQNRQTE